MTNLGDWALIFPAIAFSSLIVVAYLLGKQEGQHEERRKQAVRRAHRHLRERAEA